MTFNLLITSDLLPEKNLLDLLLSFGNTHDKLKELTSFGSSMFDNLGLTTFSYFPSSSAEKVISINDSNIKKTFGYKELHALLQKEKSLHFTQETISSATHFQIEKECECYIKRLSNHGIIYLEGKGLHNICNKKTFQQVIDKFIAATCLLYDKDTTMANGRTNEGIELEQRESSLSAIIESSADGIYAIDKSMKVIFINEQAKKDFKSYINVDLETGDNLKDKIDHDTVDKWCEVYYNRVFNGERFLVNSVMHHQADKADYYVENRYSPVKDTQGNIIAALEISRNVTDLKNKEKDLENNQAELKNLLEKSPTGIAKIDLDGRINFISSKTLELFDTKRNDIIGKTLLHYVHKSEHARIGKDISKLIKGEPEASNTYRMNHPTKELFYIHGVASVIKSANNDPIEFLLAFNDITEKVIAENQLSKSEKRYKSLLEGSPAGLAQVNNDGRFVFVSKKGAEILGDDVNKVTEKNFLDYIDEKYRIIVAKNLEQLTSTNDLIDFRVKGTSGKGNIFYLDGTATLLQDEFTESNSTLFIFNDVTSRVLAEKEVKIFNSKLQEQNTIYKTLIDNSFDGIDIIELEKVNDEKKIDSYKGKIVIRNEKMNEYFAHSKKAIVSGDEILEISPSKQADGQDTLVQFENIIEKVFNDKYYSSDWRINASGTNEDYRLATKLISIEDKMLLIRNLRRETDKRIQQEIIKNQIDTLSTKNSELEKYIESNLQLENFAYIASHDLKAPLRTVSSFSFLLKQRAYEGLDQKGKEYLDIVLRSSTNMQFLIDDLLAFSRVGTQQIKKKEIDIGPMLKRILLDLNTNIEESNAKVNIHEMPEQIFADESMMIQIFQNLINNGLKFIKPGISPVINIRSSQTKNHWTFKIEDNGIGIKEENVNKIFGIFEKLHSNDVYEGTGLGLSICRKIIEMHHGNISVESEYGQGSSFIFSIEKP